MQGNKVLHKDQVSPDVYLINIVLKANTETEKSLLKPQQNQREINLRTREWMCILCLLMVIITGKEFAV